MVVNQFSRGPQSQFQSRAHILRAYIALEVFLHHQINFLDAKDNFSKIMVKQSIKRNGCLTQPESSNYHESNYLQRLTTTSKSNSPQCATSTMLFILTALMITARWDTTMPMDRKEYADCATRQEKSVLFRSVAMSRSRGQIRYVPDTEVMGRSTSS
jgi:hypothetical protein